VRGKNDPAGVSQLSGWATTHDYAELLIDGRPFVMCHYPLRSWNGQHRGSINVHGHSHGKLKSLPRQIDVGVDAWEYRPVSAEAVVQAPTKQPS
jgi:calcineurin-like phosphoesterase family protein